jgi:thioredoxin-like negative regulator of GroEL
MHLQCQGSDLNSGMTDITSAAVFDAMLQGKAPLVVLWSQKSNVNCSTLALDLTSFAPGIIALAKTPPFFVRVDVDANADLAMRYSIRAVPSMMLFVDGSVVVSETTEADFLAGLKKWIV